MMPLHNAYVHPDSIEDRVFLGEGLFETIKVKGAKPLFARPHWDRLSKAAEELGIPLEMTFMQWQELLLSHIKKNDLIEGGIKVIVSSTSSSRGISEYGQVCHIRLYTFEYLVENQATRLMSASWRRDENNPIYRMKSTNYLESILAKREALVKNKDDVLFFNTKDHATETTIANIFIIKTDTISTPKLEDGILAGITRARIQELCAIHRIAFKETSLTSKEILEADAMCTSNSLQGIRFVQSLDDHVFSIEHSVVNELKDLLFSEELNEG